MNIRYLQEFLIFQQHMNLTAAAKALFISQPALSNHIAALEKELGVALLHRAQPFSLTNAGRTLVAETPQLLALHDSIVEKVREADANGGTVAIARNHGTRSSNEDNFDILVSLFSAKWPGIYIRDIAWDEASAYRTLSEGEADCVAVNYVPPNEDAKRGVRFVTAPNFAHGAFRIWMSKSHPLAQQEHITWESIDSLKMLFSSEQRINNSNMRELCRMHNIKLEVRTVPDFGWSYLRAFRDDEVFIMDTGFEGYRSFETFPDRILKPIEGPGSEAFLHIGYLEENRNPALGALLDFIEEQRAML